MFAEDRSRLEYMSQYARNGNDARYFLDWDVLAGSHIGKVQFWAIY
jgi:hypothetical protein